MNVFAAAGVHLPPVLQPVAWPMVRRMKVPYDKKGHRVEDPTLHTWLDLSDKARIRLTDGHNVQGSRQPMYSHIGGKKAVKVNGVLRSPGPGVGTVVGRDDATASLELCIEGVHMRLGLWWLDAATRGGPVTLPVVNI